MNEKLHFKMYKSGKRWLTAALGLAAASSFALAGQSVHAAEDQTATTPQNMVTSKISSSATQSTDDLVTSQNQGQKNVSDSDVPASVPVQAQVKSNKVARAAEVSRATAAPVSTAAPIVPSQADVTANPDNTSNSTATVGVTNNVQLGFADADGRFVPVTGNAQFEQDINAHRAAAQWQINSDYVRAQNMIIRSSFTNTSQKTLTNISAALQMNDSRTTPNGILYLRSDQNRIDANGLKLIKVNAAGQETDSQSSAYWLFRSSADLARLFSWAIS